MRLLRQQQLNRRKSEKDGLLKEIRKVATSAEEEPCVRGEGVGCTYTGGSGVTVWKYRLW